MFQLFLKNKYLSSYFFVITILSIDCSYSMQEASAYREQEYLVSQAMSAIQNRKFGELKRILSQHPRLADSRTRCHLQDPFQIGDTLLHYAAKSGNQDAVDLMLKNGAKVDALNSLNETPLHSAAQSGNKAVVELLLSNGASINAQGGPRGTPLLGAIRYNHVAVVRLLIDKGADVNLPDRTGYTPLHAAADACNPTTLTLLIRAGARVNAIGGLRRNTPLHEAVKNRGECSILVMQILIRNGANLEAKSRRKRTPLHVAVANRRAAVIQFLIEQGADIEAKDEQGRTPLHIAVTEKSRTSIRILLDRGASVSQVDNDGKRPIDLGNFQSAFLSPHDQEIKAILLRAER